VGESKQTETKGTRSQNGRVPSCSPRRLAIAVGKLALLLAMAFVVGLAPSTLVYPFNAPGLRGMPAEAILASYPRPSGRFGIHDTPILGGSRDPGRAVSDWRSLGVSWVTVLNPREDLLAQARAAGIEVVARVYSSSIYEPGDLAAITTRVVRYGFHYVVPYNEPNLLSETGGDAPDPVDFARRWVVAAEIIRRHGGYPVLTPLAPGGNYPDQEYFTRMLAEVVRLRGVRWLLEAHVTIGVHAYILGPGEDLFERFASYAQVSRAQVGLVLPMLAAEGGIAPVAPPPSPTWSPTQAVVAAVRTLRTGELPDYVLAVDFWLYANRVQGGRDAAFEPAAWLTSFGPREVFRAVQDLATAPATGAIGLSGNWPGVLEQGTP